MLGCSLMLVTVIFSITVASLLGEPLSLALIVRV